MSEANLSGADAQVMIISCHYYLVDFVEQLTVFNVSEPVLALSSIFRALDLNHHRDLRWYHEQHVPKVNYA